LSKIINRIDFFMLQRMTDLHELGLYSASYRVIDLLIVPPLFIMATLFPVMSNFAKHQYAELKILYRKATWLLGSLGFLVGVGVICFSAPLIRILFGDGFVEATPVLNTLVWSAVFIYIAIPGGNLLISVGRTTMSLIINFIGAVGNIILNMLWIPKYGCAGAALATSVTYFYILAAVLFAVRWALIKGDDASRRHSDASQNAP